MVTFSRKVPGAVALYSGTVKRLPELDALRGVAALSVVLLHFHDMWLNGDVSHLTLLQVRIRLQRLHVRGLEAVRNFVSV